MQLAHLEAHVTQKELKQKILKEYLEMNKHIWVYNIKMDLKETGFL